MAYAVDSQKYARRAAGTHGSPLSRIPDGIPAGHGRTDGARREDDTIVMKRSCSGWAAGRKIQDVD
jgi:hypothetical protein